MMFTNTAAFSRCQNVQTPQQVCNIAHSFSKKQEIDIRTTLALFIPAISSGRPPSLLQSQPGSHPLTDDSYNGT